MSLTREQVILWCGRMEGWLEGQPLIPNTMAAAMRDEINELRDASLRSLDREWVPVTEILPELDGFYWCYTICPPQSYAQQEVRFRDGKWWTSFEVTHWQPLPAAPGAPK